MKQRLHMLWCLPIEGRDHRKRLRPVHFREVSHINGAWDVIYMTGYVCNASNIVYITLGPSLYLNYFINTMDGIKVVFNLEQNDCLTKPPGIDNVTVWRAFSPVLHKRTKAYDVRAMYKWLLPDTGMQLYTVNSHCSVFVRRTGFVLPTLCLVK